MSHIKDDLPIFEHVQKELRDGEKLVWADQAGKLAKAKTKIITFLFGIPFLAFLFFGKLKH